ncbi:MAG: TetR/AcrR family transcriptional regulator [Balneolaceae bacterium]|nr:TetR/AcrR family transcriptional regulator [Balneolaceae bacterium]
MPDPQKDTEEIIFDAACNIFQRKGYDGARMQEIADEAEINKSMLHYYYRSKDKLFKKVYQRQMSRFFPVVFGVLDSDLPLDEKIEQLIVAYYQFLSENPRIAQFIIHEMNQNPERLRQFIDQENIHPPQKFYEQVTWEIEQGNLAETDPKQLLVSIIGLILFPFLARTMVESVLGLGEEGIEQFLHDRKDFLLNFILNGINYQKP